VSVNWVPEQYRVCPKGHEIEPRYVLRDICCCVSCVQYYWKSDCRLRDSQGVNGVVKKEE
jgi:hypothetical protein